MRSLSFILLLITSSACFAQVTKPLGIDPDLIDPEMIQVMYLIAPNDLKISAYSNGTPSTFSIKLCQDCQTKFYTLSAGAELLLNEQALPLQDLTIALIKKKFDSIQLGINRGTKTVTYLYLGGINEISLNNVNPTEFEKE